MERRLFLAIALSILVLLGYYAILGIFSPKTSLVDSFGSFNASLSSSPTKSSQEITQLSQNKEVKIKEYSPAPDNLLEVFENSALNLFIDPQGSGIRKCEVKSYSTFLPQIDIGLLPEWQSAEFKKNDTTNGISMSYSDEQKNLKVVKSYKFTGNNHIIEMAIKLTTLSNTTSYVKYSLNVGVISSEIIKNNPLGSRYLDLSISLSDKILRNNFSTFNPVLVNSEIKWIGIRDRCFCSIIKPLQKIEKINKYSDTEGVGYQLDIPLFELGPGQEVKHTYLIYLGPQQSELIAPLGSNAEQIVNFGFFDTIAHMLLGTIKLLYRVSRNWGLAIILFSILVFLILSPLSIKSFRSMKKMQELQPLIQEIREQYKDNPQKMQKAIMELYREKKVNPFGGCLPLLLQMPIFIALFQAFMRFIEFKEAKFLWIKDLSEPDRLFLLPNNLPVIGNEFNILPIIMIVLMLLQQRLSGSSQAQDPATAQQQKIMSIAMSVVFGLIFYHMPSGLVLYWTVNSLLMFVFQAKVLFAKSAV